MPGSRAPRTDWWSRNWRWAVPLGAVLGFGSLAAFVLWVFGMIKSCEPYERALTLAKSAPAVAAELGRPVSEGFLTTGSVNLSGPSGTAELSIPLRGPKGRGHLHVEATRKLGEWRFDALILETEHPVRHVDLTPRGPD